MAMNMEQIPGSLLAARGVGGSVVEEAAEHGRPAVRE